MIEHLRRLLAEAFALQHQGSSGQRVGRAYGAADGYMLALMDGGFISEGELRQLVAEERARLLGPGSRTLAAEPLEGGEVAA